MWFHLPVMSASYSLPTDADALRALLLAERVRHAEELERLTAIIKELQRHRFGRRAERLDPEQLALALEDVEQTLAAVQAAAEADTTGQKKTTPLRRQNNRGALPPHLPREEIVIDVADKTCACCGGLKHRIGECQSASKFDPRSASNFDPLERRVRAVALAPSELVGVAETARARVWG